MPSSYTASLRLNEQGTNDNPSTWGTTLNNGVISLLDDAIAGLSSIDVTGVSDVSIASTILNGATDNARRAILKFTGTLGNNINLIIPSVPKIYDVWGAQTGGNVTVKTASGLGVSITPGLKSHMFCDGTDTYQIASTAVVQSFPSGGIIMWSGTIATIPAGWYLCNGSNSTPNLVDKFIVCANQDSGGAAKTNLTGSLTQSGGSISNTTTDSQGAHTHTGTTGDHVLSVSEIPAHSHTISLHTTTGYALTDTHTALNVNAQDVVITSSTVGGGLAHNHPISSDGAHTHTITVNPPVYYALAYIMKS